MAKFSVEIAIFSHDGTDEDQQADHDETLLHGQIWEPNTANEQRLTHDVGNQKRLGRGGV
ncbi:hypothetical protein [Levilactobacillus cerevisiae]|uniref:hypothetical protein n=1 Tax=Levilactobacillus cerevisiae TaxID=1704076 RepID=UPI0013DE3536|nr:hypothetical protein [Levilactobacillus cerevisiae]